MMTGRLLIVYYAATAIFVLLDFGFGINIRAAFLEHHAGLRVAFYLFLLACLALILWRPQWSSVIGTVESGITLVALIFGMALRTMVITDQMIETGQGAVTIQEVINFIIAGGAAYVSYMMGVRQLTRPR